MLPTQQRLGTNDHFAARLHLGLIVKRELGAAQRTA
jgi:hypothetical protein